MDFGDLRDFKVELMTEEELDNAKGLYLRCPFMQYPSSNNFKPCLRRQCMAFRCDDRTFWCARLEPARGEESALHPIEMLDYGVDNW